MSAVLSLFLLGFILSYFWVSCITDLLSPLRFNFRLGRVYPAVLPFSRCIFSSSPGSWRVWGIQKRLFRDATRPVSRIRLPGSPAFTPLRQWFWQRRKPRSGLSCLSQKEVLPGLSSPHFRSGAMATYSVCEALWSSAVSGSCWRLRREDWLTTWTSIRAKCLLQCTGCFWGVRGEAETASLQTLAKAFSHNPTGSTRAQRCLCRASREGGVGHASL